VADEPFSSSKRTKLLLTEGSSTSARQTLFTLGGRYTIDVVDAARVAQGRFSRFVRRWYCGPAFSRDPEGYLAFVLELLRRENYEVLFPTHEQVYLLSRFRDSLGRLVGLVVPEFATLDHLMSKANFVRLLDELGLPHPQTEIGTGRKMLEAVDRFPCWIKVAYSTAGEGVHLVANRQQLQKVIDRFERAGWLDGKAELLVQQPAKGIKGAVSGLFQHGRLVAYHCDQALAIGVGGSTLARVTVDDPQAVEDVRRIGERLQWHGPMAIECFRDPSDGSRQYLECNPRIGETINATLAGVNFCELMVRMSLGEQLQLQPGPRPGVRTHQGFLALMAIAASGGTRRQMIAELARRFARQGYYHNSEDELTRPRHDWPSFFPALGMTLLLLLWPRVVHRVVSRTVENYGLAQHAVERIRQLPDDLVDRLWQQADRNPQRRLPQVE